MREKVLCFGKLTTEFNELTMGYENGANLSNLNLMNLLCWVDEERIMYKNLNYGNSSNSSHDVQDLSNFIKVSMIWHFLKNSLFTCEDGSYGGDCYQLNLNLSGLKIGRYSRN